MKKLLLLVISFTIFLFSSCSFSSNSKYTEELEFKLTDSRISYYVSGLGTAKGTADGRFDVVIPATYDGLPVVAIYDHLFEFTALTSIVIPETVEYIGDDAFYDCYDLDEVTFLGTIEQWKKIEENSPGFFDYCPVSEIVCSDGIVPIE